MLEALLFAEGTVPQRVAEPFWRGTPQPPPAHRTLRLVDALAQHDPQRWLDVGVTGVACGPENLQLWSMGQTWDDTLYVSCDETCVIHGQARSQGR
jgi:hypothetical protein